MALGIDDLRRVVAAQRRSGKNYMMTETAVYTREFLYAGDLAERGELGSHPHLVHEFVRSIVAQSPLLSVFPC
jgi:hypothetical protein